MNRVKVVTTVYPDMSLGYHDNRSLADRRLIKQAFKTKKKESKRHPKSTTGMYMREHKCATQNM